MADDDMVWDVSMPGAGAQRANAIAQLYFRLLGFGPLTILVVDSLCAAFSGCGATASELSDYLGVAVERVTTAVESIPPDMRCTARDLHADDAEAEESGDADLPYRGNTNHPHAYRAGGSRNGSSSSSKGGGGGKQELRYYLNYKRLLPLAYAHVTRVLLLLCTVPLPVCAYTERVRRAHLPSALRGEATGWTPSHTQRSPALTTTSVASASSSVDAAPRIMNPPTPSRLQDSLGLNISATLQQLEALHGICCPSCQFYVSIHEFVSGLSSCPVCAADVLRHTLEAIRDGLNARCACGESLVTRTAATATAARNSAESDGRALGVASEAVVSRGRSALPGTTASRESAASNPPPPPRPLATAAATRVESGALRTPLAHDPFLVQQALVWLYLYSTPFAYVHDGHYLVRAEDILTAAEYERRLHGKASVAHEFRAVHRHAASVRVRVVSQADVDRAKQVQNAQKMAKRAQLPPWLCHYTTAEYVLATGGTGVRPRLATAGLPWAEMDAQDRGGGGADDTTSTARAPTTHPAETAGQPARKRGRETSRAVGAADVKRSAASDEMSASRVQRGLTHMARRIAQRYKDNACAKKQHQEQEDGIHDADEFELVPLSL